MHTLIYNNRSAIQINHRGCKPVESGNNITRNSGKKTIGVILLQER